VVIQASGQVCFLKLHHGRRSITLAEAEAILVERGDLPSEAAPQTQDGKTQDEELDSNITLFRFQGLCQRSAVSAMKTDASETTFQLSH